MPLCDSCNQLDLDQSSSLLGPYDAMLEKATAGCNGCQFFRDILRSSIYYETRPFNGQIVFLNSLRLDCRKPGQENGRRYACDDLLFDVCKPENSNDGEDPELDCKREVPASPTSESRINLMKSWIRDCSEHATCKTQADVVLPPLIIEVDSEAGTRLNLRKTNGQTGQYAVLSYCHSNRETLFSSTRTWEGREGPLDKDALPQTFRDAIEITQSLGLRFLWIDALCSEYIDEEDAVHKRPRTTELYSQCAVLLSADIGDDCHAGMLSDRKVLYSPPLGNNKNRYLRQRLLRWRWDIDASPLRRQGWAAEAMFLSPRILHFTKRQLAWECAGGLFWEASGIRDDEIGSGQRRMNFRKETAQPVFERILTQLPPSDDANIAGEMLRETIETWCQCIDAYSALTLPNPADKLAGIANLAAAFDRVNLGQYLAGIWENQLTFGLCWSRSYAMLEKPKEYRAPSWSWASIDGSITSGFNHTRTTLMQEQIDNPAWMNRFGPRVVAINMNLNDPSNLYVGFKKSSALQVEATCIGFHQLAAHFDSKTETAKQPLLRINAILDSSPMFDCPCCRPGGVDLDDPDAQPPPVSKEETNRVNGYQCMIVQGEDWSRPDSDCFLMLLQSVGPLEDRRYERVGCVVVEYTNSYEDLERYSEKANGVRKEFEGFEWERRELELV